MIVLDTNVISNLMQVEPDRQVVDWLDGIAAESIWTTTISVFEIEFGLQTMAKGKRQQRLQEAFRQALEEDLQGRVLDFDQAAAAEAAQIAARLRAAGQPVEIRDAQIAGIVVSRQAALATRNIKHFAAIGLKLVNPWKSSSH